MQRIYIYIYVIYYEYYVFHRFQQTPERMFSYLKILKTYLINTMKVVKYTLSYNVIL